MLRKIQSAERRSSQYQCDTTESTIRCQEDNHLSCGFSDGTVLSKSVFFHTKLSNRENNSWNWWHLPSRGLVITEYKGWHFLNLGSSQSSLMLYKETAPTNTYWTFVVIKAVSKQRVTHSYVTDQQDPEGTLAHILIPREAIKSHRIPPHSTFCELLSSLTWSVIALVSSSINIILA